MKKTSIDSFILWFKAFLPSIAWASLIFYLSSRSALPSLEAGWSDYIFKKLSHMFVYGVLFLLLHWGVNQVKKQSLVTTSSEDRISDKIITIPTWKLALIITFAYALTDEFHQTFIPYRYGTLRDLGYDMLGVLVALLKLYKYI